MSEATHYKFTLDLAEDASQATVTIPLGDVGTRYLDGYFVYQGAPYWIAQGTTITFTCKKPDGTVVYTTAGTIKRNYAEVLVTSQMLATAGECECEYEIISATGGRISSPHFTLFVTAATMPASAVESTNEYAALDTLSAYINTVYAAYLAGSLKGKGIDHIAKTGTSGRTGTYTIYYDNGTTWSYTVMDGEQGATGNGIVSITKTATVGLVDTYTILFTDGTTTTFNVTNGSSTFTFSDGLVVDANNNVSLEPNVRKGGATGSVIEGKLDSGSSVASYGIYSHAEGSSTTDSQYSHAEGISTITGTNAHCAHSEGYQTNVTGHSAHGEGYQTKAHANYAHSEGYLSEANGVGSHAEGNGSKAYAEYSHTEGKAEINAAAIYSHAEGEAQVTADARYAHAEGKATANAWYAHAEGEGKVQGNQGYAGHAEGSGRVWSMYAHAEGINTLAQAPGAHTEGSGSQSGLNGYQGHAEGFYTQANAYHSHAEGAYTVANGDDSHTEGFHTTAGSAGQHVSGKWNVIDTSANRETYGTYAEIVGNGTADNARSNARTLDWSGNAVYAGTVTASNGVLSSVSASATGTATDEVQYITINGTEKKLPTAPTYTAGEYIDITNNVIDINDDFLGTIAGYINDVFKTIAPLFQYSIHVTYHKGDYVIGSGNKLYRCVVANTTAGSWVAAEWEEVNVTNLIKTSDARIDDIIEKLKGNVAKTVNGTTPAYTQTVPDHLYSLLEKPKAMLSMLGGKTQPWNQLVQCDEATSTHNGITFTNNNNGTFSVSGTATARAQKTTNANKCSVSGGHKVFLFGTTNVARLVLVYFQNFTYLSYDEISNDSILEIPSAANRLDTQIAISEGVTASGTVAPRLIDLTAMGYSDITSLADPRIAQIKAYAAAHPEYNAGALVSAKVDEVKSVGANVWDEQWEIGGIVSGSLNSKNFIPALPSTAYRLTCLSSASSYFYYYEYDANKTILNVGGTSTAFNTTITTTANTRYLKIRVTAAYGTTYHNDIQICLNTYSAKTTYHPYTASSLPIPTAVQNLDGYGQSAGTVYNYVDLEPVKYSNMKSVDLGSLNWVYTSTTKKFYSTTYPTNIKRASSSTSVATIITDRYSPASVTDLNNDAFNMCIAVHSSSDEIQIKDLRFTDAASFKAAMSGVILHYEATSGGSDYEAKLYHKRVGSVDLGSLTFAYHPASGQYQDYFDVTLPNTCKLGNAYVVSNIVCEKGYTPIASTHIAESGSDNNVMAIANNSTRLIICDKRYTSAESFNTAMNGVMLYYELASEQILDVTDLVNDDNFIEVENSGTVTFHQQNDVIWEVPNTTTYLVDVFGGY